MYKCRIWDEKRNVLLADCDDDGETGASSRMLHLMDVSGKDEEKARDYVKPF